MADVFLCFVLCLSYFLVSPSSSTTIKLNLSPPSHSNPSSISWDFVSAIAKSTIERAHHLKHHKKAEPYSSSNLHGTSNTPLYPRSYGGYSISLAFGTPPQSIPLVFDTGSSLLWVPCTSHYDCANCTFSGTNPKMIATFKPKLSSTTKIIGCRNRKCGWLFGPNVTARCPECGPKVGNCTKPCPMYILQYGLGATSGVTISESLDLNNQVVPNFFLGCSLLSVRQPQGIAGFGRAPTSLPNQLKLNKFSYCLVSHKFDDTKINSKLVLASAGIYGKNSSASKVRGVNYTPFRKNPNVAPYDEYYYITLRAITVGKKQVKVELPYKYLVPDKDGNGGTIVDSGSTFSFMDGFVFKPLVKELAAQTGHLKRASDIETESGFGLCFHVSSGRNFSLPELVFHYKGGLKVELPVANYFSFFTDLGVLCLTIVSDTSSARPNTLVGPAVILGNYQQQNFYIEYDLKHQRMGFKRQQCV